MRISPLDIKKHEFKKSLRGYDSLEVNTFLEMLSSEFTSLVEENQDLKNKIAQLDSSLSEYKKLEQALQTTLLAMQQQTEDAKKNAEKEAQLILQDAHLKSRKILEESNQRLSDLRKEIVDLIHLKETYLVSFRAMLEAQKNLLDNFSRKEDQEVRSPAKAKLLEE